MLLQERAAEDVQYRLSLVKRVFLSPAIVTPWPEFWRQRSPEVRLVPDDPVLELSPGAHDLVIHAMALHWAEDPLGQLIQAFRALKPDGLFILTCFGGETLAALRHALLAAEVELTGGAHPRVAPMAELQALAGLLGRAGFAMPVADRDRVSLSYPSLSALCRDLRAMGETNALAARSRHFAPKRLFERAEAMWPDRDSDGRLLAEFNILTLTGWTPHSSQPKPLRPGSATTRLADVLGATERKL